jgi:hypothetical protein
MKTMKLISRVEKLLKRPPDELPVRKLRKTVKSLKQKQEALEERLRRTRRNGSRRRLQLKIAALRVQRARGAAACRCLIALHEGVADVERAPGGSVVFLADQGAAAQERIDQRRLHEKAEDDYAEGDRLDSPPVGQIQRQ